METWGLQGYVDLRGLICCRFVGHEGLRKTMEVTMKVTEVYLSDSLNSWYPPKYPLQ